MKEPPSRKVIKQVKRTESDPAMHVMRVDQQIIILCFEVTPYITRLPRKPFQERVHDIEGNSLDELLTITYAPPLFKQQKYSTGRNESQVYFEGAHNKIILTPYDHVSSLGNAKGHIQTGDLHALLFFNKNRLKQFYQPLS